MCGDQKLDHDGDAGSKEQRLQDVIATCREAYSLYDFRKVFGTLNQFGDATFQKFVSS